MNNTPVELTKPQLELIPDHHKNDLQRLSEITGHSFESLVAGYWYRFGEVQTLQIELEWKNKVRETLESEWINDVKNNINGWREAVEILEDYCSDPIALKCMVAVLNQIDRVIKKIKKQEDGGASRIV